MPVVVVALLASSFVAARWAALGGDSSRFIVAGDRYVDRTAAPAGLAIARSSTGYDGQFFYRLALDPFTRDRRGFGIELDTPSYRQQRIIYPLLAWLLAAGEPAHVPWALIVVNVAALTALAWLGVGVARSVGRSAVWGVVFPAYPGFVLTLARDLSEIVAAAFLLGALLAVRRRRWLAASTAFTLAALTRETTLIVPLALAGTAAVRRWWAPPDDAKAAPLLPWVAAALPVATVAVYQLHLAAIWGVLPIVAGAGNFGPPLLGLWGYVVHIAASSGGRFHRALSVPQMALLALLAVLTARALRRPSAWPHERVAWLLWLAMLLCFSDFIWIEDWAFMRAATEFYLLGMVILVADPERRPPAVVAANAGALWVASAILRGPAV